MPLYNIEALKNKINEGGKQSKPFFFIVNYEMNEGYFVENPLSQNELLFQFPDGGNKPQTTSIDKQPTISLIPNAPETYKSKFDSLYKHFINGEITLANLTDKTAIESNLSIEEIFALSQSPYQIFLLNQFVCFSPERFVQIRDGIISSNPMKGTIDANIPDAENVILNDPKEIEEHTSTVRLLSDELSLVAEKVEVKRFRYIDHIKTNRKNLLQVSSEIAGTLPEDYQSKLGDIIFSLLPGGSIVGTPKQKVQKLLSEIELIPRGYYCGIAGYFDGESFDSAVLIRFVESENEKLYFRSGGGVTIKSVCENEYQEVLNKIYFPF